MIRTNLARRTAAVLLSALVVQAGGLPYFVQSASAGSDRPRIIVLPFALGDGSPDKAPGRFRELVEEELKGRDAVSVISVPKDALRAAAPAPKPSADPSPEALQSLEEGQAQLADLKFDAAATALKKGLDLLAERPESIDYAKFVDGNVSLAVALFRMGDEEAAQKALFTVARIAPEYRLPDGKYPPIFVREFDKARRRAEKAVKGSVNVDGPPGATAFVDGKDLGMVPVLQDNLAAGPHFIKVEGTRGELFGQAVDVKSGTVKVKAAFAGGGSSGPSISSAGPVLDDAAVGQVAKMCQSTGAGFALVGVVYRSGEHQLTAATALFSMEQKSFAAMKTYTFDEEVLTANVEAFKLADDVADAADSFPRASPLPLNLAKGAGYKVADMRRTNEVEVAGTTGGRRVLTGSDKPVLVPEETPEEEGRVRALDKASVSAEHSGGDDGTSTAGGSVVKSGGPAWWVWALVGVGVAAAAGGTYYGVSEATRPVTGTVTAKW